MNTKPVIAIVGRPNVGKSALFNKIARRQIALVFDRPGVTRDRIEADCHHHGKEFRLIDTGGIGLGDDSGFEKAVQQEVEIALEIADHVLFVVDAKDGLTPLDKDVAKKLRKNHAQVHLVINKVDHDGVGRNAVDFDQLGFASTWMVSATHGIGVDLLMDELSRHWEAKSRPTDPSAHPERIAIVGVPNVGKSSIINALFASDRVIVSDQAGTTRDSVDVSFEHEGKYYTLIDTAGMRKESRIHDELEQIMTGRSVHAIKRSHICILVIDALRKVGQQEKKIAALIAENKKPCVLVVNKWDLVRKDLRTSERDGSLSSAERTLRKEFSDDLRHGLFGLNYASIAFVSAKDTHKMHELMKRVSKIASSRTHTLGTGVLNRILEKALTKKSPPRKGGRVFKIYYATQKTDDKKGIPTVVAFVNNKSLLPDDYLRYLDSCIRKEYAFEGCPIAWDFKEKLRHDPS